MFIPRILPHSIPIALLLKAVPGANFKKMRLKESVRENKTPKITSGWSFAFSAIGPIIMAMALKIGENRSVPIEPDTIPTNIKITFNILSILKAFC